jgi:pyruvate ferredoxin oxidoreductase alpha subunit
MSIRDCGWVQVFANNGQEVFDHVLFGYRVAESEKVMLPVMIHVDGFILTHVIEPVEFWETEQVERYLPEFKPVHALHPDRPVTMGCIAGPSIFSEVKVAQDEALIQSKSEMISAWKELGDIVGRYYKPIEGYKDEDAETLFITQGCFGETVSLAVDALRDEGKPVGLLMDRLWRPFPFEEFRQAVANAKSLIVIDRAISYGGQGGPLALDLRSALYKEKNEPTITNFICGPASRDVTIDDFKNIYNRSMEKIKVNPREEDFEYYGVRGK